MVEIVEQVNSGVPISKCLEKYPESFDNSLPDNIVYSGKMKLEEAGKLVLSPTRTYAPVIKKILEKIQRQDIHGMVHCSGGAQTKVLHFVDNLHIIKDNLFPTPPLFKMIQEQSKTDWKEMYKVFNMGHRMEIYVAPEHAQTIIDCAKSFNVGAQIVGRCETANRKHLTIKTEHGVFEY